MKRRLARFVHLIRSSLVKLFDSALHRIADGAAGRFVLQKLTSRIQQDLRAEIATQERNTKDAIHLLRMEMLRQRGTLVRELQRPRHFVCAPRPTEEITLSERFDQLQATAPAAFAAWRPLLDVNQNAYEGLPIDSCSVPNHPIAPLFRDFLMPYLRGAVLDIGCGPQAVPAYLEGHPFESLAGIDPLPPSEPHPFLFVRTVAEYLPWADDSFDVVVVATSLDHVLLLDRALDEIHRVLKPDGRLVLWVGFIKGSPCYDPYSSHVEKVDDYHLFHCGESWFLGLLSEQFQVEEKVDLDKQEACYNSFLVLSLKIHSACRVASAAA